MKSTIALFAILALAVFVAGQSPAQAGQTSDQSVRSAQGSMARIATLIPAPAYSTFRTAPVLVDCQDAGASCEENTACCSGVCNPPDPGTPRGTKGTCGAAE